MDSIKGLLFDKDGTLFDFQKTWGAWADGFLRGLAGDPEQLADLAKAVDYDLTHKAFAPTSVAVAGTPAQIAAALGPHLPNRPQQAIVDYMIETASQAPLVPPVPLDPLLARMRSAGCALGVATNDAHAIAMAHLETAGITQHFDYVAGFDSGMIPKPDPAMINGFLTKVNLEPHQVAMIGDSTHDLIAGRTAGTRTIAVLTGTATADDLAPHADHILDHIGQLPELLGI
jgi:phosphoglycolate phosphatase